MTKKEVMRTMGDFWFQHGVYTCETSPMNSAGMYHKVYHFEDGAEWREVYYPVKRRGKVLVEGLDLPVMVELEAREWSNSDGEAGVIYEPYRPSSCGGLMLI